MRHFFYLIVILLSMPLHGRSQGVFWFWNPGAPTYLLMLGGQLAGPDIWGQALIGTMPDSLSPVGFPRDHRANGLLPQIGLGTPYDAYTIVQVQMAVWDGTIWGTNFATVPTNQFGFTDIVPVELVQGTDLLYYSPQFTIPAVVPPVPEPSQFVLAGAGILAWFWIRGRCKAR
jgi:hypothetical protein